jgi:hypothetical protein
MKRLYCLLIVLGSLFTESCTEPYALQTENYESAIVIEATLTDEFKHQEIKLSRTYKLEEDGPDMETGAVVFVTDSNGNQYNYSENNGKYISQDEFKALPDVAYQLHVVTSDGKTYASTPEKITSSASIEAVTPHVTTNRDGDEGIQMTVTTNRASNNIEYYRFTYAETNKIIAPKWIPEKAVVTFYPQPSPDPIGDFDMVPWPYEAKTCFTTEDSNEIFLQNTAIQTGNTLLYPIRFIGKKDYKIANRYSINVTLYDLSLAAYNYYDALKKNSTQGSPFSQNQTGFYSGNIKNMNNPKEKVIGFFDVSHVSHKRIFFNFEDIFPGEPKPEYPYECIDDVDLPYCFCFSHGCPVCEGNYILYALRDKNKLVLKVIGDKQFVTLTSIRCGDCTTFSSNIRPPFWVD